MHRYLDIPMTIIITLTLIGSMLWPMNPSSLVPQGSDKLMHLTAFAALAFPLASTGRFGLLPVFIGASAFGGIIELIQPSFNRSAELGDWLSDIIGSALGVSIGLFCRRLRGW